MSTCHLKKAWERYLDDHDGDALLQAIADDRRTRPQDLDYPYAHRICDIALAGRAFRVVRLVDELESVFIYPCDTPSFDKEGVPYWLTGEQLQRWFRIETAKELEEDDGDDDYFHLGDDAQTDWRMFK